MKKLILGFVLLAFGAVGICQSQFYNNQPKCTIEGCSGVLFGRYLLSNPGIDVWECSIGGRMPHSPSAKNLTGYADAFAVDESGNAGIFVKDFDGKLINITNAYCNSKYYLATNSEVKTVAIVPKVTEKSLSFIEILKKSGQITNVINELFSSGEVCAVRGHSWASGCGHTSPRTVYEPNAIYTYEGSCLVDHRGETRHCINCKTMQTKTEEWK